MKISIIIPCYNEAESLPELVALIRSADFDDGYEIILVDNGSTDETETILPSLLEGDAKIRSIRINQNQGYGHGILEGLKSAEGDILAWTHADLQTNPADIKTAAAFFEINPNAFVKGRRYGRPVIDVLFTVGMSFFEILLLRRIFWDINAQPTVFSKKFFDTWDQPPTDFSLDLFAYFMAKKFKLAVKRFPVHFGDRQFGKSHWNVDWKSKYKFIRRTINFSLELKSRGL